MISESVYARAYARALLGTAQALRDVDNVAADVNALRLQWHSCPELRTVCGSRGRCLAGRKSDWIGAVWGDSLSPSVRLFLEKLLEHGHLHLLPLVLACFQALEDRAAGRRNVEAVFACEPQESEKARIRQMVAAACGPTLRIRESVDASLLAGFRLRIDDRLIDASLAGRLARLKQGLMKPPRPEAAANRKSQEPL